MARGLDNHWTPEVAAAWTKAYAALKVEHNILKCRASPVLKDMDGKIML